MTGVHSLRHLLPVMQKTLIRVKMDSLSQHDEHESCAKRLKLDLGESKSGVLCDGGAFGEFSAFRDIHIDGSEGKIYKICLIV